MFSKRDVQTSLSRQLAATGAIGVLASNVARLIPTRRTLHPVLRPSTPGPIPVVTTAIEVWVSESVQTPPEASVSRVSVSLKAPVYARTVPAADRTLRVPLAKQPARLVRALAFGPTFGAQL